MKRFYFLLIIIVCFSPFLSGQDGEEGRLTISGELTFDERFLFGDKQDWAWNENRLTLKFGKRITGNSKFVSELWIRNIGLPDIARSSDLFNKGIVDPINIEIREAYIHVFGFLTKNLDLKIGRQRIVWGTADKINPTDNLNPPDMEDILDFGRRRGSDAINASYYLNNDLFLQLVYLPFFQPANMPVGLFADALTPDMNLPAGLSLKSFSDTIQMPRFNLWESSTAGFRFKGYSKGIDFSFSYLWGYDGLPVTNLNIFTPIDMSGGVNITSRLSFMRTHVFGADFATDIGGAGLWGEAALVIPDRDLIMTNDLSALYPLSPDPVLIDSVLIDKPYFKFIVGGDYNFRDGSYFNIQYLHGFMHERGSSQLNDYFFMRYEKRFFNEKLLVAPLGGAFIISDWKKIRDNSTIVYVPQISYKPTDDIEISFSSAVFNGKGDNMFSKFNNYDMFMFAMKYNF